MSSLYLPNRKSYSRYGVLIYQQKLLEENYPFLHCIIRQNVLVCMGWIRHPDFRHAYKIKIECVAGVEPKSTILQPIIEPSKEIHMYPDYSLCLHYPPDMKWNEKIRIYLYTLPWISEWILFYELFLVNGGKWEGKESLIHITFADMNINKDED